MTSGEASLSWLSHAKPDLAEVRELSSRIVADAQRAADVIDRIRATIVQKEPEPVRISLDELVDSVVLFLEPEFRRQAIDVVVDHPADPVEIVADRVQIQQVAVNLAMNAVQAMVTSQPGSRRLVLRTRSTATTAVFEIEDSGPGIPPDQIGSVFKTFFTTKPSGTGMGLSICRSIVEARGGRISAANVPEGTGAIFTVELPPAGLRSA
jgi:signal transduction histidine kinase